MRTPCWRPGVPKRPGPVAGGLLKDGDDHAPIFIVGGADLRLFALAEQHHPVESYALVADVVVNLPRTAKAEFTVFLSAAARIGEALNFDISVSVCRLQAVDNRVELCSFVGLERIF